MKSSKELYEVLTNVLFDVGLKNKDLIKAINKKLTEKGISKKIMYLLYNDLKNVDELDDITIMCILDASYSILKQDRLKMNNYFGVNKTTAYEAYMNVETPLDEVVLDGITEHEDGYTGTISYKQIYDFMNNNLLIYYKETQREGKLTKLGNKYIKTISINKKNIKEMSELAIKGELAPSEIKLNVLLTDEDVEPQVYFKKEYKDIGELCIKPEYENENTKTLCTIADGYHRLLAITNAVSKHLSETGEMLQGYMLVTITEKTVEEIKQIILQTFKRSQTSREFLKTLESNDYTKFVDNILKNTNINVANTYADLKTRDYITYKTLLIDVVKCMDVKVNSKSASVIASKEIAENIEIILDYMKSKDIKVTPNSFIPILIIADKMRKDDTLFLNIDKVNIETDNKLTTKEIIKEYNRIKEIIENGVCR